MTPAANPLDPVTSAAWLAGVHKASYSVPVTYTRGSGEEAKVIEDLAATFGESVDPAENNEGVVTTWSRQDWVVTAADLDFDDGAGPVEPAPGDRITLADGQVYEVALDAGQNCFAVVPPGVQIAIHSKRIA